MTEQLIQGSEEWLQARLGSLGASQLHDAVAKTKSGYGTSRDNLMMELALQRVTGKMKEPLSTRAILQGKEREPVAREAYSLRVEEDVVECGLYRHPNLTWTHASPDGLVGLDGVLEIKCPEPAAHYRAVQLGKIKDAYILQMHWQMACTGRLWCDFVSFNSDFPPAKQLWIKRIHRNDEKLAGLTKEVQAFLIELNDIVINLTGEG